jgi:hypothetical protein
MGGVEYGHFVEKAGGRNPQIDIDDNIEGDDGVIWRLAEIYREYSQANRKMKHGR